MGAEACLAEGVRETQRSRRTIVGRPDGLVLDRVQSRLSAKYHNLLLQFASYDETPPPRGAALMLLWLLSQRDEGSVAVDAARLRYPPADDGFRWFLASNLARLFDERPRLRDLLCYNREGGVLSIEDPQLEFYLENLNWPALARDSGHLDVEWTEQGPRFQRPHHALPVRSVRSATRIALPASRVLHLSDLHFSNAREAVEWAAQLREDLHHDFRSSPLTAVVLSGDLTNRATPDEFAAAAVFIHELRRDFELESNQLIIVPGNHDLSWEAAKDSYKIHRQSDYKGPRDHGRVIESATHIEVLDDEARYRERFANFAAFYFRACAQAYSLDYEFQATLHPFPAAKLLFIGFNSAYRIDHHFRGRAEISSVTLGQALRQIDSEPRFSDFLKIAVWHHPIRSPDDDRIRDTGFMERLAQSGFRLALHGHIHRAEPSQFRHDLTADGRRIDLLGAGTFGAPTREWQPGVPLQYQLLEIHGDRIRIRTRCRDNPQGAWRSDARWTRGPGESAADSYDIEL
jgi:3',5'-cyclic AMP phosphodiesterase CpdA